MSPQLRAALRAEAKRLRSGDDPVEIVRAVADTFAALDRELAILASVRYDAVKSLRKQGLSYAAIARLTGLTAGRVSQIVHDSRHR